MKKLLVFALSTVLLSACADEGGVEYIIVDRTNNNPSEEADEGGAGGGVEEKGDDEEGGDNHAPPKEEPLNEEPVEEEEEEDCYVYDGDVNLSPHSDGNTEWPALIIKARGTCLIVNGNVRLITYYNPPMPLVEVTGDLSFYARGVYEGDVFEDLRVVGGDLKYSVSKAYDEYLFEALEEVGGSLEITGGRHNEPIRGFDSLTTIGGTLKLSELEKITAIPTFEALEWVGGVWLDYRDSNLPMEGFEGIKVIRGSLRVDTNRRDSSLFPDLVAVGCDVRGYMSPLFAQEGQLRSLKYVGGDLRIDSWTRIYGPANLVHAGKIYILNTIRVEVPEHVYGFDKIEFTSHEPEFHVSGFFGFEWDEPNRKRVFPKIFAIPVRPGGPERKENGCLSDSFLDQFY